jgi:hypothetical protein
MRMFSSLPAALAGTVIVLALTPGLTAGAESLGRLFHSPVERARIDHPPPPPAAPTATPPRLDGIITRSGGRPVIFLDGQATPADTRQIRINDASARVTTPDGQRHHLRVGDSPLNTGAP